LVLKLGSNFKQERETRMAVNYKKFINISSPLLLRGETGTGKSHLAQIIFNESHLFQERFLTVHLASLKEDLLESELFGHRRGAFTGAVEAKSGYLQDVGKGTLFLDEIGELSLEAQKKLLYLLEEKKFTPIGSTQAIPFQGRIIMATNKNLEQMVKEKTFREDLYFRMSVFQIELKPLALDLEKLNQLVDKLFLQLRQDLNRPHTMISEELRQHLLSKSWKGNVRELKNTLEYALVLGEKRLLQISDLPECKTIEAHTNKPLAPLTDFFEEDYTATMEKFEKLYFQQIFDRYQGKVNLTARKLGISKTTLIAKAKRYGINTLRIRAQASEETNLAA
jgi:two-component system NtrC family response regulator